MPSDPLDLTPASLVRNTRAQHHPFAHAVSIGTNCYAAWLLRALGLRRAATPFDWLFSHPVMVAELIEQRFAGLLDATEYEPEPGTSRCAHRDYRRRFGVEHVFNHHDPTRPAVQAYLQRCVDRFGAIASSSDKALFLMINTAGAVRDDVFARLGDALDRCGPNNTLLCINVGCTGDTLNLGFSEAAQIGRHRLRTYRSTSEIDGVRFGNPLDDLVLRCTIGQFRFDLH